LGYLTTPFYWTLFVVIMIGFLINLLANRYWANRKRVSPRWWSYMPLALRMGTSPRTRSLITLSGPRPLLEEPLFRGLSWTILASNSPSDTTPVDVMVAYR
jgi:hypothetical protein